MKRFLTLGLTVLLLLFSLSGCGYDDGGGNVGLVFVNDSDAAIVTVVAEFADRNSGAQNADGSPWKRGDYFGFEAGEYPVTVLVYDRPVGSVEENELARVTIENAPPEGKRWYVTAWDCAHGVVLTGEPRWPGGVLADKVLEGLAFYLLKQYN